MQSLPPISNPLRPNVNQTWIAPIRFRTKPYREWSDSLTEALDELEARYPSHRVALAERRHLQRQPRKPK